MNKSIVRIVIVTALLLLVPLVAMQFTDEVDWDVTDFIVMGVLLVGTGLAYEFVAKRAGSTRRKVVIGVVVAAVFLLVWAELAVGIFGTPFSGS